MITKEVILNEEQQLAFEDIAKFIVEADHRLYFYCLSGKAGCGKTEILAKLPKLLPNRRFIVGAISHKAKKNIYERVNSRNVTPMTIAQLLAMKFNNETGEFSRDDRATDIPIAEADIVIIDEASMIDEDALAYIMKKKLHKTIIIFAGDEGQIRPIRSNKHRDKLNNISPVFLSKYKSTLKIRVRQGEGNPILEDMDYYWDMAKNPLPLLHNLQRKDKENSIGSIKYRTGMKEVLASQIDLFREAKESGNTDLIKVITYRNEIKRRINRIVRKLIWENPAEYEVGDLMIMGDTYSSEYEKVENSVEFALKEVRPNLREIGDYKFNCFELTGMTDDLKIINIPVLAEIDKDKFSALCKRLFNDASQKTGQLRARAYQDAWAVARYFADAVHGYSLSAHRAQGSSYTHVINNLSDMLDAPINRQEQASLIYTGGTRARKNVIMVNKEFINPE